MNSPISPGHYKNGSWEAIEVIEAVHRAVADNGGPDVAYNVGAALKYLLRCGRKGETREQLEKAEWHLRRAINMASSGISSADS